MPKEHPHPKPATIKLLYARAFACAFHGCKQPLYREDLLSGTWALNSRICHIHARSEGGPRWDANQSADENRADSNLLLMCPEHASAIDILASVSTYTPDLLREWKAGQIETYRRQMTGWPLTTAMAEQALQASISGDISIHTTQLNLAGEGGRAPGAGGGGGGAIGHGSRAGAGGPGGTLHYLGNESYEPPETVPPLLPNDEKAPGAGGGGAGAIGPNSIAGDGGGGGDMAIGLLAVEPGDTIDMEIGEGGKGSNLPGKHAEDGVNTVLLHRGADGSLKRTIRIKGGAGPKSGALPDTWLPITEVDVQNGFHITALLPMNAGDVRDGLFFMLGVGWNRYSVPQFPQDASWLVLCNASWGALNSSNDRGLQLCLVDPDHKEASRAALQIPSGVGANSSWHWLLQIGATFHIEGVWMLRIQSADLLLSEFRVAVSCN